MPRLTPHVRTCLAVVLMLLAAPGAAHAQELRPGVWAGERVNTLPLPTSGYQAYLVGEWHGVKQVEAIVEAYLGRLQQTGLRDMAIEEDAVYECDAQAYVEWRTDRLPPELCLRAGIIDAIRRFNKGRAYDRLIRIRLVDVDSPAAAIRQHLLLIKKEVDRANVVQAPGVGDIKANGLKTVDELARLTSDGHILSALRTIRHSIRAYQQGLEIGIGQAKGSPYLDDREQAIAGNLADLLRDPDCRGVLALYGADHVSRARKKDGGPERDRDFAPLALRLERAGFKVFSLVIFPLAGRSFWRGQQFDMPWTAADGSLASGETLDRVLAGGDRPSLLYVDRSREKIRLPSQDITALAVDAFLLPAVATPIDDRCAAR